MYLEPWHWLIIGGLLMVAELFTTSFFSLFFGLAAVLVAAIAWLFPLSWFIQVLIWLGLAIVLTVAWFKVIYPKIKRQKSHFGSDDIIGQTGMIIVPMNAAWQSKVRFSVPLFGANEWVCRVVENQTVRVGERVKVIDVKGNELLVMPTP